MKDHNNNNRVDASDTLKNIPEDASEALKDDYKQTKADMKNAKDKVADKVNDLKDDNEEEYRP